MPPRVDGQCRTAFSESRTPQILMPGRSCPRRPESLRRKLPLRPASILSPHFRDRLRYGFLDLLRCLVTKRSAEPLQNLKVHAPAAHPAQPRDLSSQNSSHDRPNRPNHIQHRDQQDPNDPGLEIREVGLGRVVAQQFRRGIDPIPRATPPASATPHQCSSRPPGRFSQCEALVAPPEELPRRPNETVHRSYPRDSAKAPPPRRHPPQPKRPLPPPPSCPLSPLTPLLRVRVFRSRPHAPTRSPVPLSLSERTSLLIAQNDPLPPRARPCKSYSRYVH